MQENFYITTPIYYVNDAPHIGSAYTTLACDIIARFHRLDGKNVKFLTGTDEHGQKVAKSAEKKGIAPQKFTDNVSKKFRELCKVMNFSNDDFIRTTQARHKKAAENIWNKLKENGFIYEGKYEGWYSVRDEAFYSESEIVDEKAPTGAPVEWVAESSYFFALSKFQDKLLDLYQNNPDFIRPKSRKNEVINFVKSGLEDLSISRTTFDWGIKVPNDSKHVMYVWLDALTNYLSAIGYPENTDDFNNFWPADAHVVGKDITRFHAIYWPAFLMAAGLETPKSIISHGWWTNEGEKISKSLGNTIDPIELVEKYGLDQVRFFLMREMVFGNDGNFSYTQFTSRINNELANKIGNLSQRTISFIHKTDTQMPNVNEEEIAKAYDSELLSYTTKAIEKMRTYIENYEISKYMDEIITITDKANAYVDKEAPWTLKKTDPQKMYFVLFVLAETIKHLAIYLIPVIPDSANKMLDQLNISSDKRSFSYLGALFSIKPSIEIDKPEPIFTKIV